MSVMEFEIVDDELQYLDRDIQETFQRLQEEISIAGRSGFPRFSVQGYHVPLNRPGREPLPDLRSVVEFGAKEMDRLRPDWFMDINLDTLNLRSGLGCILGQLFGDFNRGVYKLGLFVNDTPCKMGLNLHGADYSDRDAYDAAFNELTQHWIHEVETRLDAAVA